MANQKNTILRQSYSNSCVLNHQNFSFISEYYNSTHSLPLLFEEKASFAQIIAEEKNNLQFFPSFRKTNDIIRNEKGKKKLMRNFYFLPYNIPNNSFLATNNIKISDDEKIKTCMIHSSNFAINTSSDIFRTKRTKSMIRNLRHQAIGIANTNRQRRMYCVERHINYMSHDQTKAALCFILQLNT